MERKYSSLKPEVWAGLECTINRVGDSYTDQLARSGHYTRPDDVAWFCSLGVKTLRYPLLWEHHQMAADEVIDWSWATHQVNALRNAGVQVIAELLHHGSGPSFTELLDPAFPTQFADYALNVAKQFPWITHYTPINEPLTTARFSGLYGIWYPHRSDDRSFVRMMINQIKGIKLAMKAVRSVNPDAILVQTEDLGYIHSTGVLQYQASFENERRWLTYDLLMGRVTPSHALWEYLHTSGISEEELEFFLDDSHTPDIIGWNYYVTSERYLDHRIDRYPSYEAGGNGVHRYVDLEAVRIGKHSGIKILLQQAWKGYGQPMAITEVHLGCTREEQLRWFMEVWDACCELKDDAVDIVAVTAWALLGAFDWNSLLTRNEGFYEPGIFDISGGSVRPTALAHLVSSLATSGTFIHPVLNRPGWWHDAATTMSNRPCPLLVFTTSETYSDFANACATRNIDYFIIDCATLDMTDLEFVEKIIDHLDPLAIVYSMASPYQADAPKKIIATQLNAPLTLASIADDRQLGYLHLMATDHIPNTGNQHVQDRVNPFITTIIQASIMKNNFNSVIVENATVSPQGQQTARFREVIHTALDLLIDESFGIWKILPTGLHKIDKSHTRSSALHHNGKAETFIHKMEEIKYKMTGKRDHPGLDDSLLQELARSISEKLN